MSPAATLAITYSLYGIVPTAILVAIFLRTENKYHLFWLFGLVFIVVGSVLIAMGEQIMAATAE